VLALVSYVAYAPPWSVTDDDRRLRAKQYCPYTMCRRKAVIYALTRSIVIRYQVVPKCMRKSKNAFSVIVVMWWAGFNKVHVQPCGQCGPLFHWKSIAGWTRCST